MTLHPFEVSLAATILLLILEVVAGSFVFLSLATACLAVAIAQAITGHLSLLRDTLLFAAVALLVLVVLRHFFSRPGDTKRANGDVNEY
jgi:membrane protein implicated in regulation of membrane protease activity